MVMDDTLMLEVLNTKDNGKITCQMEWDKPIILMVADILEIFSMEKNTGKEFILI